MPKLFIPVTVPEGMKWCPDCPGLKPLAGFGADRARHDGLRTYCSPCAAIRTQAAKQRRKDLNEAGRRMTAPSSVTPEQREAAAARFVEAFTETPDARKDRIATAKAAKPRPVSTPSKPRKAPRARSYPPGCCAMFPTPADAKMWHKVCGNRG